MVNYHCKGLPQFTMLFIWTKSKFISGLRHRGPSRCAEIYWATVISCLFGDEQAGRKKHHDKIKNPLVATEPFWPKTTEIFFLPYIFLPYMKQCSFFTLIFFTAWKNRFFLHRFFYLKHLLFIHRIRMNSAVYLKKSEN